jgi:glucose/arabinose dehydrogenase
MRRLVGVLLVALPLAFLAPGRADAALRIVPVARNFSSPILATAPRGSRALFVVEQGGRIYRISRGRRTLFLDVRELVAAGGEQGLLGLAFHPRYPTDNRLWIHYTNRSGDTRVARLRTNAQRTRARRSTRHVILRIAQPFSNHNGGQLAFGPDGRLYLGLGDGGSGCDPDERAQSLGTRLGKVLRFNLRTGRWGIWAYGVRNMWRFSFDRATGDFYGGDVGQGTREEVDYVPASRLDELINFGWDVFEGDQQNTCEHGTLNTAGSLVHPILSYGRTVGFTVIGGHVYRGQRIPAEQGRYFYGDLSGWVRSFRVSGGDGVERRTEPFTVPSLVSFGENGRGELMLVSHGGTIYRLISS